MLPKCSSKSPRRGTRRYVLTEEEHRQLREGLDELDRGEAATDAEVRAVFDKYRSHAAEG